ncbi:MAG: Adenylate cyclase [Myxococcales bacterium]|nr:Adenylate cyclase [Myxococcales bacterium]
MATTKVSASPGELTKAQILELHPWPAEFAKDKKIDRLWVFDLPGTPAALWPWISDTSRMNRALGTAEMTFVEKAGKRFGSSKAGGVKHEWLEVPWNWVVEQWLTSLRIYERGFMRVNFAIHRLEPIPSGTRVYLYYGVVPRGALGAAAIRIGFPTIERAYKRILPALAKQLDMPRPEILQLPPPPLEEESEARLRKGRDQLLADGLPAKVVDALIDFIRTGDDADLHRIQIRERARVWKVPENDLLRVALHATRGGLLDLSWDTICPHCRGVRDENSALSSLKAASHCEVCEVTFGTDTPEAVEVTFRVHPSIREVPEKLYCSAEPSTKDFIRVQHTLGPGAKATLKPKLEPGRYTVWAGHRGGWYIDVDDAGADTLTWEDHPEGTVIKTTSMPTVHFENDSDQPERFSIERVQWKDDALRPGMLLSFQDFRDLFSEDYIGADVKLAVGEQTLLFTDVVGSTAFYAVRGDPSAFVEIKKHFDEVFAIVVKNRGAVVKTIGDAVMATFVNPVDAIRASQQIHNTFHPKRTDTPIRLRISLNTGPCIAVRLNSNADFFGGTVNIAAKLQALAEGYQIAMSEATYRGAGVAEFLAEQQVMLETLEYTSKALPAPVSVKRWTVYRE